VVGSTCHFHQDPSAKGLRQVDFQIIPHFDQFVFLRQLNLSTRSVFRTVAHFLNYHLALVQSFSEFCHLPFQDAHHFGQFVFPPFQDAHHFEFYLRG
jgi:hypothetical protein